MLLMLLYTLVIYLGELRLVKHLHVWRMSLQMYSRLVGSLRRQSDNQLIVKTNELIKYSVFHAVENVFIGRNLIYSLILDSIKR